MRRIVERHLLIDTKGFGWEAHVTVPCWDPGPSHGPDRPLVTIHTPNDRQASWPCLVHGIGRATMEG